MTTIPIARSEIEATRAPAPVLFLSPPPPDAVRFARYRAALAEQLEASGATGVLLVSAHWLDPQASPNPLLHIGAGGRPVDDRSVIFAERIAAQLTAAGVPCDLEQGKGSRGWPAAMAAFDRLEIPVLHLSLPVNVSPDLMVLAGRALAALRDDGALLVACGDRIDDRVRARLGPAQLARARSWARGETPARYRGVYPLLFMMGASREGDRLVDVCSMAEARIVALDDR